MTDPHEQPGPDVGERIGLATALHPGCFVALGTLAVIVWGIFGWWLFR